MAVANSYIGTDHIAPPATPPHPHYKLGTRSVRTCGKARFEMSATGNTDLWRGKLYIRLLSIGRLLGWR